MAQLSNWTKTIFPQRNEFGCVPTGYEQLIRYLKIQVNLETFQEDFDLGQGNSFDWFQRRLALSKGQGWHIMPVASKRQAH